eukprot:gene348-6762_t
MISNYLNIVHTKNCVDKTDCSIESNDLETLNSNLMNRIEELYHLGKDKTWVQNYIVSLSRDVKGDFSVILRDLFFRTQSDSTELLEILFSSYENETSFLDYINPKNEKDILRTFEFLIQQERTNLNDLLNYAQIDFYSILEKLLNENDNCIMGLNLIFKLSIRSEEMCIENLLIFEKFLNEELTESFSLNCLFELCYIRPIIQNSKLSNDDVVIDILIKKMNSKNLDIQFISIFGMCRLLKNDLLDQSIEIESIIDILSNKYISSENEKILKLIFHFFDIYTMEMNILNSIIFILFKQDKNKERKSQILFLLSFVKENNILELLNHIIENVQFNFSKEISLDDAKQILYGNKEI